MEGEWPISNDLSVELSTSSATLSFLPFVDDTDHTEATILEAGQRNCWTMPQLGRWGFVLMGAELGGGRETAMLTGGAAGIPAWWMAFISLSLSAVSLLLLYPLMYKVYHQDTDDMLSNKHIEHVVKTTVSKVAARLHITIDWEVYKAESRELSIDIMVPYGTTENTLSDNKDVRAEVLRELLEEFSLFRVFKPVQLTVRPVNHQGVDLDTGIGFGGSTADEEQPERRDYSAFFGELHTLARRRRSSRQPRPVLCPSKQRDHGRCGGHQRRSPHLRLDGVPPHPPAGFLPLQDHHRRSRTGTPWFISSPATKTCCTVRT